MGNQVAHEPEESEQHISPPMPDIPEPGGSAREPTGEGEDGGDECEEELGSNRKERFRRRRRRQRLYRKIRAKAVWTSLVAVARIKPPADRVPWDGVQESQEGGSAMTGGTFTEEEFLEPGARFVSYAEVHASTGAEREAWRTAAEAEVQESFSD